MPQGVGVQVPPRALLLPPREASIGMPFMLLNRILVAGQTGSSVHFQFARKIQNSRVAQPSSLSQGLMIFRFLLSLLLIVTLAGCEAPYKKSDAAEKRPLKDQGGTQSFQGFVGRLRTAVGKKDRAVLASMMTADFGYRWDDPAPGETVFDYWDQNNVWPELGRMLREKFEPNDLYMVAPAAVVTDPNYAGYRAGMRIVGGSWRFAYFVPAEPAQ